MVCNLSSEEEAYKLNSFFYPGDLAGIKVYEVQIADDNSLMDEGNKAESMYIIVSERSHPL